MVKTLFQILFRNQLLGLGCNAAIGVATDRQGKLDCKALQAAISRAYQSGQAPFAIVATAGTTVTGNVDPIETMAAIAKAHHLWFHVDASYGGALAFSPQHQHFLKGINQADSITFNPQKWLYVTKTCAMTLFRDAAGWQSNFRIGAPYMGKETDAINLGEVSLQGTRHGDVLKLWMTLQHLGKAGCAEIIERNFAITQAFAAQIRDRSDLRFATQPELNIICFRSEPKHLSRAEWNDWNLQLQSHLLKQSDIFLSVPIYQGERWLKAVLLNPFTQAEQIIQLFQQLDLFHAPAQ